MCPVVGFEFKDKRYWISGVLEKWSDGKKQSGLIHRASDDIAMVSIKRSIHAV
jgi:hypothetical protein